MRKVVVSLALALAAAYTVEAGYRVVQLGDVITLARQGVSDRTIVSFLENRELAFVVGTDEILRLREAGVGEPVIRYLIERTAPREPDSSGAHAGDDPGHGGAYIEYGPRNDIAYYVGAVGPYVADLLVSWLERTLDGGGHHYGGYDSSRYDHGYHGYYGRGPSHAYDHGHGYSYYDRGHSYLSDRGHSYHSDRGHSNGRSYSSYGHRSYAGRSYSFSYLPSTSYYDHDSRHAGDKAVPLDGSHDGGRGQR
jgi:hypothetical protein